MCFAMIASATSGIFGSMAPFIEGLGTAMSVAGPVVQGMAAQKSAEAQARANEYNAQIAESQAEIRAQKASKDERLLRIKGELAKGTQRAAFGAAGLVPDSGSPLNILLDTQRSIEQDANTIRYNAALDEWGLGERANLYRTQASYARSAGSQAMTAGVMGGLTALGTSVSRFSDKWDWMNKPKTGKLGG